MTIYEKLMGNPFVDAGVSAICEWLGPETQPEEITTEDLEIMINQFAPIYSTPAWRKNLYSIFPNHVAINPTTKKDLRTEWLKWQERIMPMGQAGDCLGCGRRVAVEQLLTKTDVPLTGSGNLRNFFPLFNGGQGYCAACALAVQFIPLSLVSTGGRFLMLHSNVWRVQRKWAQICVSDIQSRITRNEPTGCFNPGYTKPRNSLFYMTSQLIDYKERRAIEDVTMQIFCFSNYNQDPDLKIFHLPAPVFRFLRYAYQNEFRRTWQHIVRSGYQGKVESEEENKKNAMLSTNFCCKVDPSTDFSSIDVLGRHVAHGNCFPFT